MLDRLTQTLDFQGHALVLRAERQRVIASNIANADTPGYQARDFDFAAALREATAGQPGSGGSGGAPGSDIARGVMSAASGAQLARPGPALQYAVPSQTSIDGNTVDMDRERAAFVDNSVKYESTLRFINGSVRSLMDAMKGPNQA
jgi:flagellar basal-body rod protein FlgB